MGGVLKQILLSAMAQDDEACRPDDGVINCWDDRTSEQIANGMSLLPVYIYESIRMYIHMLHMDRYSINVYMNVNIRIYI